MIERERERVKDRYRETERVRDWYREREKGWKIVREKEWKIDTEIETDIMFWEEKGICEQNYIHYENDSS